MIKLKTTQSFKFGQKNIIPYAGEVQISDEGIIEVEKSIAEKIVLSNCGFDFLEKDPNLIDNELNKVEKNDLGKEQDNDLGGENDTDDNDFDEEELRKELNEKTIQELKVVAQESGFEEEGYKDLKKKEDLINYLVEKFKNVI